MKMNPTTRLGRLRDWIANATISFDPANLENAWISPPLPTRRFGPDAWVAFSMSLAPTRPELGPFQAWIVFRREGNGLRAYLERPIADAFGIVGPLPRPAAYLADMPDVLLEGLGTAGERFFAEEMALPEDQATAADFKEWLSDGLYEAMRSVVAPDFFNWLAFSAAAENAEPDDE